LSEQTNTPLSNRTDILADLWIRHKDDPEFIDFVSYNDLGLPLAYALSHGIVDMTEQVEMFINETWDLLIGALNIEDTGFETLDEVLSNA
jgi:hypothetical protein